MTRSEEYWLVIGWPIGFKDLGRNSVDRRIDFDVEQSKVTNLLLILYFLDYYVTMTSSRRIKSYASQKDIKLSMALNNHS